MVHILPIFLIWYAIGFFTNLIFVVESLIICHDSGTRIGVRCIRMHAVRLILMSLHGTAVLIRSVYVLLTCIGRHRALGTWVASRLALIQMISWFWGDPYMSRYIARPICKQLRVFLLKHNIKTGAQT